MSGLQPLERQWTILRTLAARRFGATVRELADEHGVSQKTIRRDLILLRNLGFPVAPRQGAHGRNHWVATIDATMPPLTFDISKLLALYLGRTLLQPLAGTVVWDAAHSAFCKIKATLGESALQYLASLSGQLHRTTFRDSNDCEKAEFIDDLMVAIEDCRITFITYQSARSTEPLTYDVYPYGLVWHRGSLYLVAQSHVSGRVAARPISLEPARPGGEPVGSESRLDHLNRKPIACASRVSDHDSRHGRLARASTRASVYATSVLFERSPCQNRC